MKKYSVALIERLDIDDNAIRVAFVAYSIKISDEVGLFPPKSKVFLKERLHNLKQPKGMTNMILGIECMRMMFRTEGRPSLPRLMVIYTDGILYDPYGRNETIREAELAKGDGITIMTVEIGNEINR